MFVFLDNLFPWFGDMVELGGDILILIVVMAALMWTLILERLVYFTWILPTQLIHTHTKWRERHEQSSWYALQFRRLLLSRLNRDISRNLELIKTIVKVCPLLGLLGTVMGMLEIFDALAVTGDNNARTTAGGVSKATVSTMAGMVVAISGLMVSNYLLNKAQNMKSTMLKTLSLSNTNKAKG